MGSVFCDVFMLSAGVGKVKQIRYTVAMPSQGPLQTLISMDRAVTSALTIPAGWKALRAAALCVAHSGDSLVLAALLIAGWFVGDNTWKARVLVTTIGLVLAEISIVIIKVLVKRNRPPGTAGWIYRKTDPYSFPSGHAARAALLSITSAVLGPAALFVTILAWSPVMLLSRIAIGIHFVLDIVVGLVVGAGLSVVVLEGARWVVTIL